MELKRVFVEHADTPASQTVANEFARESSCEVVVSLYDYSNICYERTLQQIDDSIEIIEQEDLFSDNLTEQLLEVDIFILTTYDVAMALQILEIIQQYKTHARIILLSPHVTLLNKEDQDLEISLSSEAEPLPQFSSEVHLIRQIEELLRREYTELRQFSGQIIYHGIIYNSNAFSFNPFEELCEFCKICELYPYFADGSSKIPLTHSARIATYIMKEQVEDKIIVDEVMSQTELYECLENGLFGSISEEECDSTEEMEKLREKPKQGAAKEESAVSNNGCLMELRIDFYEYQMNNSIKDIILTNQQKEQEEFENQCVIMEREFEEEEQQESLSPSRQRKTDAQKHFEKPIFKSRFATDSHILLTEVEVYISKSTFESLFYNAPIKLPIMDDFSIQAFNAFLNYEKSEDEVIENVQNILLKQMVVDIPQITDEYSNLIELYAYREIINNDLLLTGNSIVNDLDNKLSIFSNASYYKLVSPEDSLRFLYCLSENCKNEEFWSGFIQQSSCKVESQQKERKDNITFNSCDFIAFICRLLGQKSVSNESKNNFKDLVNSFETEEDAYLLAFVVSLYLRFSNRCKTIIYYGFDNNDITVEAFKLLKDKTFMELLNYFSNEKYATYYDIKKTATVAKGELSLFMFEENNSLFNKELCNRYYENSHYTNNIQSNKVTINPILNEIIMNEEHSKLYERRDIFDYYKLLADEVYQELQYNIESVEAGKTFEIDLVDNLSIIHASLPSFPCGIDVSALFLDKALLKRAYYLECISEPDDEAIEVKKGKEKAVQESKTDMLRSEYLEELDTYDKKYIFELLRSIGDQDCYKLVERKHSRSNESLQQIMEEFGADALKEQLLINGLLDAHLLVPNTESESEANSNEQSVVKNDSSRTDNTQKDIKQKQTEEESIQEFEFASLINEQPLFIEQLSLLCLESERYEDKLVELEEFNEKLEREEAERVKQEKLKMQGISEEVFDNNSFGSNFEKSNNSAAQIDFGVNQVDESAREQTHIESVNQTPILAKSPTKSTVSISRKSSIIESPKVEKELKKSAREIKAEQEEEKRIEEELNKNIEKELEQEQILKEEQNKKDFFSKMEDAEEYLSVNNIENDLSNALASLMLAIQSNYLEPSEQLTFLGEELIEMSIEKNASCEADDESEELKTAIQNNSDDDLNNTLDPVIRQMEEELIFEDDRKD